MLKTGNIVLTISAVLLQENNKKRKYFNFFNEKKKRNHLASGMDPFESTAH
jgi:hypothetical protein